MRKSHVRIEREDATSSNDHLKRDYEDYLRRQRGLSEKTIFHCWRFADRFLRSASGTCRDLSQDYACRTLCDSCSI